jgi:hypothetical protein
MAWEYADQEGGTDCMQTLLEALSLAFRFLGSGCLSKGGYASLLRPKLITRVTISIEVDGVDALG